MAKELILDSSGGFNYTPGINSGGLYNNLSGLGGPNDKSKNSFFIPTLLNNKQSLETVRVESWAANRFISLPIDQMFIRKREFEKINDNNLDFYINYLDKFKLNQHLANAMKSARLYGSAFLVFITKENILTEPINFNTLRKDDLENILVFDRYSCNILKRNFDVTSINYQQADSYNIFPHFGRSFEIHASRVFRFDGQMPLSSDGWTVYNHDFGVSEIIPILQAIYQEAQTSAGISQLISEMSIPVIKSEGLREALGSTAAPDSPSIDDLANSVNQTKSIYNAIYLDAQDDFSRTEASVAGVADILNTFAQRLASASGIPATVFLGKSPMGMNATGDSDLEINAQNVSALQENKLRPAYNFIDKIMTKTAGIDNNFSFNFPSLIDLSEETQTIIATNKANITTELINSEQISTDEAREILSGDSIIGNLEPENTSFKEAVAERKEKLQAQNNIDFLRN